MQRTSCRSCVSSDSRAPDTAMPLKLRVRPLRIALVGNPNVGKSGWCLVVGGHCGFMARNSSDSVFTSAIGVSPSCTTTRYRSVSGVSVLIV